MTMTMMQQQTRCKSTAPQASPTLTANKQMMLAGAHHNYLPGKQLDATSKGQKEPRSSQVMHAHPSLFCKELIII
jgi:hypothetical protein